MDMTPRTGWTDGNILRLLGYKITSGPSAHRHSLGPFHLAHSRKVGEREYELGATLFGPDPNDLTLVFLFSLWVSTREEMRAYASVPGDRWMEGRKEGKGC